MIEKEVFIEVPTWDNGSWTTTSFTTRDEFKDFVKSLFKEPGLYNFDEVTLEFNGPARVFTEEARLSGKDGIYTRAPLNSRDYLKYWTEEKNKCRKGVIFKKDNKTFYLTRDYYMWINYLPIYDKEKKKFDFPTIWDSQYHAALYELLAELHYNHVAILKKRQWGNSYIHCGKVINQYWFEDGATCKIGASLKDYVNEKGDWKFLDEYRNFLNKHTAWYRGSDPNKVGMWKQRATGTVDGKEVSIGNDSIISSHSFEKDPTSGVGGNVTIFYHEEAGIAPKMGTTYEYVRPALSSGMITTGLFIAAGSVGDLSQCQPLKEMLLHPRANSIYPVETNLLDDKGTLGQSALFIPEHWSMPPYIDEYGNSLVEQALQAIIEERLQWKKDLSPSAYQLRISQKPINIHEAFAYREESIFPLHLINKQIQRIEDGSYPIEYVDLSRDDKGKIIVSNSRRFPITTLGSKVKSLEDKRGVVCIHERPEPGNIPWGMYYASIDPVGEGKVTTSESLFSIYIYRNITEVTKVDANNKIENRLDHDKIVAWWTGRYDDINDTHELAEMLIEYYYAWTIVEKNISTFTTYMINKKKQHMLVPRSQLLVFNKDMKGISESYQEYGWLNSKPVFQHLLTYGINYLKEVIDEVEILKDGEQKSTVKTYGIERIPDIMLLREMASYQDGEGNYDRLVSYCALIAFAKIQQANLGFVRKVEKVSTNLEKPDKFRKFIYGAPQVERKPNPYAKPGNPFKNFR